MAASRWVLADRTLILRIKRELLEEKMVLEPFFFLVCY
jgi:hypothetical protein